MFTDSIDENVETIRELLQNLPASSRTRAKHACVTMEKAFNAIRRDNPRDAGAALGTAFAIFLMSQKLVEKSQETDSNKGLIQLLS